MSIKALLDMLPAERRKTTWHVEDGIARIETKQDVTHIIEAAKIHAETVTPGKEFRHAAFIPEEVLNQAFVEGWFHDKAKWKQWANAPENKCYRTWEGRL